MRLHFVTRHNYGHKTMFGLMTSVALLFLISPSCLQGAELCPDTTEEWTYWDGYCYHETGGTSMWGDAIGLCDTKGGNLATIRNRRQMHFLRKLGNTGHPVSRHWLGCSRDAGQISWVCVDGRTLYDAWATNEPHVNGAEEAAAVLDIPQMVMIDSQRDMFYRSICEKPTRVGTTSTTLSSELLFQRVLINYCLEGCSTETAHDVTLGVCSSRCLANTDCVSFNLYQNGTCQLNDVDVNERPSSAVAWTFGCKYYEPIYSV